jgi:1,4-alpha-glucan branching enzyme
MQVRHLQSSTVARPVTPKTTRRGQRPVEKPVEFALHAPQAQAVSVAGTFNDWDPGRTPMNAGSGGTWKTTVWLPAGRYEYRFVADGQWLSDPMARERVPNSFGSTNSVVAVV